MSPVQNTSRLCVHTITTRPLTIEEAAEFYAEAGIYGITVWRDALEGRQIHQTGNMLREHELEIVSLCRGGFFPSTNPKKRQEAIKDNKRAIEQAAELGAPLIVLVCGASPDQSLEISRGQIYDGIDKILPYAESNKIKLAIEPLHPMYANDRSAINTLKQANDMADQFRSNWLGVAVDVYHLWWDPDLEQEILRSGNSERIFAFHICDWKTPTTDLLYDRDLMGEGCIPIQKIRSWVESAGFNGFHEVEIFSKRYWEMDQKTYLQKIREAYLTCS